MAVAHDTHPHRRGRRIPWQPWLWVGPAVILLLVFFIYPLFATINYSFQNADSTQYVGLKNYRLVFTDAAMLDVLRNNLLWLVLATVLTVGLGLIIAVLVDRVKIESIIKSALFIPMVISGTTAGVIWRLIYIYEPANQLQIGLLNAFLGLFKIPPQAWLINQTFNNFALIAAYTWMWTGFCMVILSAALKGIPDEIIEAAKIDGASRVNMFWRITVPMIRPTLGVVIITMIINILKVFDIVYIMTGGNYNTSMIALEFYDQLFINGNYGLASALAIILLVVVIPVMIVNIRRIRGEEAQR